MCELSCSSLPGSEGGHPDWIVRISLQFTSPADNGTAWYWDYKLASDLPDPNNQTYPASIYVRISRSPAHS